MTPPIGDPNTYAMRYAHENGISFDEAKTKLRDMYGDPQAPQNNFMVTGLSRFQETSGTTSTSSSNTDQVNFSTSTSNSGNKVKTYTSENLLNSAWAIHESGQNFGVTGKEAREIKKATQRYKDEIDNYAIAYEKEHKLSEYKHISGRKNRETQWKNDAYNYAFKKFQENHPDIDLATVYYNDKQSSTKWFASHANLKPYN